MEVLVELFVQAGRAHQGLGDCNDQEEEKWLNIAKPQTLKDFFNKKRSGFNGFNKKRPDSASLT